MVREVLVYDVMWFQMSCPSWRDKGHAISCDGIFEFYSLNWGTTLSDTTIMGYLIIIVKSLVNVFVSNHVIVTIIFWQYCSKKVRNMRKSVIVMSCCYECCLTLIVRVNKAAHHVKHQQYPSVLSTAVLQITCKTQCTKSSLHHPSDVQHLLAGL